MIDAWQAFADSADELSDAERSRRLVTICLAGSRIVVQTSNARGGLPPSRPPVSVIQAAGARLVVNSVDQETRVVGLLARHWKRERNDPDDGQHWLDVDQAITLARTLHNPALLAWVELTAADQLLSTQRSASALTHAEQSVVLVENSDFDGFGPYDLAERRWRESTDAGAARTVLQFNAWAVARLARRYTGDLTGWSEAIDRGIEVSRDALEHRPSLLSLALVARAVMQRALGEQADLAELQELQTRSYIFLEDFVAQTAFNAAARGDRAEALRLHSDRAELVLSRREPGLVGMSPAERAGVIETRPLAQRRLLNDAANSAYEVALNLSESGRAELYPQDRELAFSWLDLADAVWAGWASNGLRAVAARRASLELPTNPDAVLNLITIAQEAPRPGLRANVIRRAAIGATRHHDAVRQQLDAMLDEPWEPHLRATLLASRAWLNRGRGADLSVAAMKDARAALELLHSRPVGKLEALAMAETSLAESARQSGNSAIEREAHIGAVSSVARMLLNATTFEQRVHLARQWAPSIRAALTFAEKHADSEIADLVHEVVRRDGIGALLSQVGDTEQAPHAATDAALKATTAGRADPDDLVTEPGDTASNSTDDDTFDDLTRSSGATSIRARDDAAYVQAQRVLGPLGSLIDPATLYSARALSVLGAVPRPNPVFLLQLLPSTHDMVGSDGEPMLHRRLSWVDDEGTHELTDSVPLPNGLIAEPTPDDLAGWRDAGPLLPAPLVNALDQASVAEPVRLLIVPTGLFHIEFDALDLGEPFLIERASVTIHTSLTSARHSLDTARSWNRDAGSYAVFDLHALPATSAERSALTRHFPAVQEPLDKQQLQNGFGTPPPAILAMAVHGSDDQGGWAQSKKLPTGETLSAAEALAFSFPQICVLASCHSRVRQYGVDHAGFPTAMFARGASTIIGSIGRLYDSATSQILSLFYEKLYELGDPVQALRLARLEWVNEDPENRWPRTELWSRLVVYGGAHF
jgi:hypothetical protein